MFGLSTSLHAHLHGLAAKAIDDCRTIEDIAEALRRCGRAIADADGVTVIRREGDEVVYVGEDAISPLWTGRRFPIRLCVSGMAMTTRSVLAIPDIMADRRVPLNAYVGTFVRSMIVLPIGHGDPHMAMGAYWRRPDSFSTTTIDRLTELACTAANRIAAIEQPPRAAA